MRVRDPSSFRIRTVYLTYVLTVSMLYTSYVRFMRLKMKKRSRF